MSALGICPNDSLIPCFITIFSPFYFLTALSLKPETAFPGPIWSPLQEMVVIHSGALCSGFLACFHSSSLSMLWKSFSDSMLADNFTAIRGLLSCITA